jgi:hypothetical protein
MKFKMVATAELSLTLDPMGKMFQKLRWRPSWISDRHKKHIFCRGPSNDHSWAVWFQLSKWFQRRSILKHFSYADRKSKMAAIAGHRLSLDPMGKCSNAFFSETTNRFQSAQWFRRSSLKCEKFTDDRRRTPSDGNSSRGPLVQVN